MGAGFVHDIGTATVNGSLTQVELRHDLRSNDSVVAVSDDSDRIVYQRRFPNLHLVRSAYEREAAKTWKHRSQYSLPLAFGLLFALAGAALPRSHRPQRLYLCLMDLITAGLSVAGIAGIVATLS